MFLLYETGQGLFGESRVIRCRIPAVGAFMLQTKFELSLFYDLTLTNLITWSHVMMFAIS